MSAEFDVNKVAAEFLSHNLERFYQSGKDVLKGAAHSVRLRLQRSYGDYLNCVVDRYSFAKSFFIRNEPTLLYDFYVPLGVSTRKINLAAASSSGLAAITKSAVITGTGGSGKTMLMRHLFLDTLKEKSSVPVFVELRELNQSTQSIVDLIDATLRLNKFALDSDYVQRAMEHGHFTFFFDGFDELNRSVRKKVSKEIQSLAKNYELNRIVISSRPDDEFAAWANFTVFTINALDKTKACELVEKLPFDSDLKDKFIIDLQSGLFEKHRSFLSNPLLLSIMLLTYGESADIPNKINIFYNQAYEALFQRHDALKGGFQRERLTKLDIQDFAKVFATFSLLTYEKRIFQFSRSDALKYLNKCKAISAIDFDSESYLVDCLQAVCLFVEEGLMIGFSHRSFQEYFVARFISTANSLKQAELIQRYSVNLERDNVINLLHEMYPEIVEEFLLIPGLERLEKAIDVKRKVGLIHLLRFLKLIAVTLHVDATGAVIQLSSPHRKQEYLAVFAFTTRKYGSLVGWKLSEDGFRDLAEEWIPTKTLTARNETFRRVAASNGYWSIGRLQTALDIKRLLIEKQRRADRSLEDLLKTD